MSNRTKLPPLLKRRRSKVKLTSCISIHDLSKLLLLSYMDWGSRALTSLSIIWSCISCVIYVRTDPSAAVNEWHVPAFQIELNIRLPTLLWLFQGHKEGSASLTDEGEKQWQILVKLTWSQVSLLPRLRRSCWVSCDFGSALTTQKANNEVNEKKLFLHTDSFTRHLQF